MFYNLPISALYQCTCSPPYPSNFFLLIHWRQENHVTKPHGKEELWAWPEIWEHRSPGERGGMMGFCVAFLPPLCPRYDSCRDKRLKVLGWF